jgi:hypothetical protein
MMASREYNTRLAGICRARNETATMYTWNNAQAFAKSIARNNAFNNALLCVGAKALFKIEYLKDSETPTGEFISSSLEIEKWIIDTFKLDGSCGAALAFLKAAVAIYQTINGDPLCSAMSSGCSGSSLRTYLEKMSLAASASGRSILILTSSRPGRRMAGSIMSSRLEAPMAMTFSSPLTPSISDSSWGTMVFSTSDDTPERRVRKIESISSKDTTWEDGRDRAEALPMVPPLADATARDIYSRPPVAVADQPEQRGKHVRSTYGAAQARPF